MLNAERFKGKHLRFAFGVQRSASKGTAQH